SVHGRDWVESLLVRQALADRRVPLSTFAALGCALRLNGRGAILLGRTGIARFEPGELFDPSAQVIDRAAVLQEFGQIAAGGGVGDNRENRPEELQDLR